jgi:hypothetical protein
MKISINGELNTSTTVVGSVFKTVDITFEERGDNISLNIPFSSSEYLLIIEKSELLRVLKCLQIPQN